MMQPATRKFWLFIAGLIVGVLLAIVIPLAVLGSGVINMSATSEPGRLEKYFAPLVVEQSVERRAPDQKNPHAGNPAAIAKGLVDYRDSCVVCHGAPDVTPAELAQGLNPPVPKLHTPDAQEIPDGEMFYIIKHGIRMTGMPAFAPTHNDDEIWKIVAFVKHLPQITPGERSTLQASLAEERQRHGGGAAPGEQPGTPSPQANVNPTTNVAPSQAR